MPPPSAPFKISTAPILPSRPLVATMGILVTVSAIAVDISLPAVPLIAVGLDASLKSAQLVIALYLAGFALAQIPAGLMADRVGRRPVLFVGLGLFLAASVVCTLSQNIATLLVARFLQGVGGAVAPVLSRAIVRDIATGESAARLHALMISILSIAPLLAPALGSALVAVFTWRSVFAATVLVALIVLAMIRLHLPETGLRRRKRTAARQLGDGVRQFLAEPQCLAGLALLTLPAGGYMSLLTSSSATMAAAYGISPQQFGVYFVLAASAFMVGSLVSRQFVTRFGVRRLIASGLVALSGAALFMIALLMAPSVSLLAFWSAVALYLLAVGLIMPNVLALILEPLANMAGLAAALVGSVQMGFGALVGLTVASSFDGSIVPLTLGMTICASATVIAAALLRGRLRLA